MSERYVIESLAGTYWTGQRWTVGATCAAVFDTWNAANREAKTLRARSYPCFVRYAPSAAAHGYDDAVEGKASLAGVLAVVDPPAARLYAAGYEHGSCRGK